MVEKDVVETKVSSYHLKDVGIIFSQKEQGEGVGAKVRRYIGVKNNPRLDPFLMLDLFNVALPAGFPDHPHRGFETVTYLISGEIFHEDFKGHKGSLGPGDIQWMTAGKGIVHAEMPASFDVPAFGFQLWINLDKKNKLCDPIYQEIKSADIPVYQGPNFKAVVISGEVFGVKGPIVARTPTYYIDFHLDGEKAEYSHVIPKGWNSMVVCYEGELKIQDEEETLITGKAAVFELSSDREEEIRFQSQKPNTKFILLAGKPINQPIAQYGPFVMSSDDELQQAFYDYQNAQNGFEGAKTWKSEIRKLKDKKK